LARAIQSERYGEMGLTCNAQADGDVLMAHARPDAAGQALLTEATERLRLSARAYARMLRVARTLADLDGGGSVHRLHVAEALSYRRVVTRRGD